MNGHTIEFYKARADEARARKATCFGLPRQAHEEGVLAIAQRYSNRGFSHLRQADDFSARAAALLAEDIADPIEDAPSRPRVLKVVHKPRNRKRDWLMADGVTWTRNRTRSIRWFSFSRSEADEVAARVGGRVKADTNYRLAKRGGALDTEYQIYRPRGVEK